MATVISPPEQRVILYDVSWETYDCLLSNYVDCQVPRLTYDRGTLEILGELTYEHERINSILASLVEWVAIEQEIDLCNLGSMTFTLKDLAVGFEPDTCFYIQKAELIRHRRQIELPVDPPPDLVIDVRTSNHSLDKFPICAALGVTEVWRYERGRVAIHKLDGDTYHEVTASTSLPPMTSDALTHFIEADVSTPRTLWVRALREWVKDAIPNPDS